MTDGQYAEMRQLAGRTAWMRPWVRWAIDLANRGPQWVPGRVRRVPLVLWAWAVRAELWRLRHGV